MFVVVEARAIPDHVKGYTDRLLVEVSSSLYVGTMSRKVAEALWVVLRDYCADGAVVMIMSGASTEQGYEVRMHGESRVVMQDFAGVQLPAWDRKIAGHAH